MPAHKIVFSEAEQFFYDHAGYNRSPDEPAWSGRARSAVLSADAERRFNNSDAYMVWEIDPDADNEPTESYFVSGFPQWQAVLMRGNEVLASLGGIDFGRLYRVTPEGHPYARVVTAELASEANL
jgi:hypothetical protein